MPNNITFLFADGRGADVRRRARGGGWRCSSRSRSPSSSLQCNRHKPWRFGGRFIGLIKEVRVHQCTLCLDLWPPGSAEPCGFFLSRIDLCSHVFASLHFVNHGDAFNELNGTLGYLRISLVVKCDDGINVPNLSTPEYPDPFVALHYPQ